MATSLPPSSASGAWAEVRAGDRVTRYRRAGTGRVVLVLCPAEADTDPPLWPELAPALARGARVVTPELAHDAPDVVARLLGFLEGLGAADVGVVATGSFRAAALALARRDGGPVARVVLVPAVPDDGEGDEGRTTAVVGAAGVPLLVVARDAPAADAVAHVTRFVHGDA